jgi:hypothetical protein
MINQIDLDLKRTVAHLTKFMVSTQELLKIMKEEIEVLERANKNQKKEIDKLKRR